MKCGNPDRIKRQVIAMALSKSACETQASFQHSLLLIKTYRTKFTSFGLGPNTRHFSSLNLYVEIF